MCQEPGQVFLQLFLSIKSNFWFYKILIYTRECSMHEMLQFSNFCFSPFLLREPDLLTDFYDRENATNQSMHCLYVVFHNLTEKYNSHSKGNIFVFDFFV